MISSESLPLKETSLTKRAKNVGSSALEACVQGLSNIYNSGEYLITVIGARNAAVNFLNTHSNAGDLLSQTHFLNPVNLRLSYLAVFGYVQARDRIRKLKAATTPQEPLPRIYCTQDYDIPEALLVDE